MSFHALAVGDVAVPAPVDRVDRYAYRSGEHELVIAHDGNTEQGIDGAIHWGLIYRAPVLWLCWRIAPAPCWSDAPFSWHELPPSECRMPPAVGSPESETAPIHVGLVSKASGVLLAKRRTHASASFMRRLHKAIREQAHRAFDAVQFQETVLEINRRFEGRDDKVRLANAFSFCDERKGRGDDEA